MHPERIGQLQGEMAQVDDVGGKQTEEHERLAPLGGVAPEGAGVLDEQRPGVGRAAIEEAGDFFDRPDSVIELAAALAPAMEPAPANEDAFPTLHGGETFVKDFAGLREGQITEEKNV